MNFNFREIISNLNEGLPPSDNFAFAMARASVIPSNYLLNSFLPQENRPDYHTSGGSMIIYPTMLGQVPMDTAYPEMGAITSEQFFEQTTKLAGSMFFPEAKQRELQEWAKQMAYMGLQRGQTAEQIYGDLSVNAQGQGNSSTINGRRVNAILGLSRSMIKAHWDTYEYLRGKALFYGEIDWTYNKIELKVDYKVPTANFGTQRNGADGYGGSTSKFWTDIRWLNTKLESFVLVMNQNTYLAIIDQPVNNISVRLNDGLIRDIVQDDTSKLRPSTDVRDRVRIYVYNKSGTIINGKTGELQAVPFVPDGRILAVGNATPDGFDLLSGSVDDPTLNFRLGYTHIAPSIEGDGESGIYSRIYTPEDKPYQLLAETAVNMLPVVSNPKRMCILRTALP